jgi:hypothetical protein
MAKMAASRRELTRSVAKTCGRIVKTLEMNQGYFNSAETRQGDDTSPAHVPLAVVSADDGDRLRSGDGRARSR